MSLVAIFAIVFAIPLFFGSWRLALAGLGLQAILVFTMIAPSAADEGALALALLVLDLVVVRGVVGPLLLARAAGRAPDAEQFELFPADLLHWVIASVLVLLSLKFAWRLYPGDVARAAHVAMAATEVLLGFFIVVHQRSVPGQALGMLTIENGAVLMEALPGHHWQLPVHAALTAVFLGLVLTVADFLRPAPDPQATVSGEEVEAL